MYIHVLLFLWIITGLLEGMMSPFVEIIYVSSCHEKIRLLLIGMIMTFNKYKGKTTEEVYLTDPSYFSWMREGLDK